MNLKDIFNLGHVILYNATRNLEEESKSYYNKNDNF